MKPHMQKDEGVRSIRGTAMLKCNKCGAVFPSHVNHGCEASQTPKHDEGLEVREPLSSNPSPSRGLREFAEGTPSKHIHKSTVPVEWIKDRLERESDGATYDGYRVWRLRCEESGCTEEQER